MATATTPNPTSPLLHAYAGDRRWPPHRCRHYQTPKQEAMGAGSCPWRAAGGGQMRRDRQEDMACITQGPVHLLKLPICRSAARTSAESAERAACTTKDAADFANQNDHVYDDAEDSKVSVHESIQIRSLSMSDSSRSSKKENVDAYDELEPHVRKLLAQKASVDRTMLR